MPARLTETEAADRRAKVLVAARWCFLNFGFAKTAFEDIAKRAGISRTLLYMIFRDKDAIYQAVFADWLMSRRPAVEQAVAESGSKGEQLLTVCRLLVLEPWAEMVDTPMGHQFLETCGRIDPANDALFRNVAHAAVFQILGDGEAAEVFLLALDGLLADAPASPILEARVRLLTARFASSSRTNGT